MLTYRIFVRFKCSPGTKITSTNNITIGDAGGVNPVNYLYMAPTAELVASGNVDIDVHHNESATPSDSDTYLAFTDAVLFQLEKLLLTMMVPAEEMCLLIHTTWYFWKHQATGDINANSNDVSLDSAGSISRLDQAPLLQWIRSACNLYQILVPAAHTLPSLPKMFP